MKVVLLILMPISASCTSEGNSNALKSMVSATAMSAKSSCEEYVYQEVNGKYCNAKLLINVQFNTY